MTSSEWVLLILRLSAASSALYFLAVIGESCRFADTLLMGFRSLTLAAAMLGLASFATSHAVGMATGDEPTISPWHDYRLIVAAIGLLICREGLTTFHRRWRERYALRRLLSDLMPFSEWFTSKTA